MKKEPFSVATQDSKQNNGIQSISSILDKTKNFNNTSSNSDITDVIEGSRAAGTSEPPPP